MDSEVQRERTLEGFSGRAYGPRYVAHQDSVGAVDEESVDGGARVLGYGVLHQFRELGRAFCGGGPSANPRGGGVLGEKPINLVGEEFDEPPGVSGQPGGKEFLHDSPGGVGDGTRGVG
ncbi:hypothetical protein SIN08_06040 [Chelativorans sp. M5D2P16]|nr:hypothetical protein [Chelativorans sp. M5D2P16]MDZ5696830.1 hypothetical protein [Chelativorans sp. M5D2P16]